MLRRLLLCLAAAPLLAAAQPQLLITDPAALQLAERSGADFARWFGVPASPDGTLANQALARSPAWASVAQPLRTHLDDIRRRDRQAGVGIARYPHRLFDARWLASPDAFFELVGVANRMDRRPFHDRACGETRLVYRLAYRTASMQSRLPMTVAVELRGDPPDADGSCRGMAQRWQAQGSGEALGRWLVSPDGPLAASRLTPDRIAQITVNLQSVRWPSAVRPDLGGHAEYLLRAFRWHAGARRFEPGTLENTPDVPRLQRDAALRGELQRWLREPPQLRALDEGTLKIPDRYLATEAVSVTPRGFARLANRPFAQLFAPHDWQAVPGSRTLRSPQAVLRRLDDLSCMGCHQSRAVAGFHLLGADRQGASRTYTAGNALALPHSPHLQDELARRARYVTTALSEAHPDPFRPLAEGGGPDGGFGAACGLGDPGFAGWTCGAGLQCQPHGEADRSVGICMPTRPAVGAVCEPSRIPPLADAWRDRARKDAPLSCGGSGTVCEKSSVGFPGGMCSGRCDPNDPDGTCGAIAILSDFNQCLAANRPFGECLAKHTRPGQLRSCSAQQPCRDDYICAQAEGAAAGRGACIPPYFLFQMRVDGHP